jgi:hypothetical protein
MSLKSGNRKQTKKAFAIANAFFIVSVLLLTLLYICFEWFESSFPQSLGGNPGFLFLKDNGFPITTSGMTTIDFFRGFLCKAISVTIHNE